MVDMIGDRKNGLLFFDALP